ncbi:MAG: MATE family efflux transporter [Ruminococcaceae bacterium]|nr:MATE family efflux transporter [Oscillospiraceae bacterium]
MRIGRKADLDMTEGPFLKKILIFIIPVCLTHVLQNLYHAADLAVIGRFRGDAALAAIGSVASLNAMIISLFMGLSSGAGIVVAQAIGARRGERVSRVLHTAVLMAALLGVMVGGTCFAVAPAFLRWIEVPANIFDQALLYIRIIFCGFPVSMVYNYAASMVRATGDSTHPLMFLTISGVTNVLFNLLMVLSFGMGVEGVAIATVVSQALSATLMIAFLVRQKGDMHLSLRRLALDGAAAKDILYIGVPLGIQNTLFNFANVLVQSAVNRFGDVAIAAKTAAGNLENFVYVAIGSVNQGAITFVGQNVGAGKKENIKRITFSCLTLGLVIASVGALALLLFRSFFVGLYVDNPAVAEIAYRKLFLTMPLYPLVAVMEILNSELRSMGKSITAMCISLFAACAVRIFWVEVMVSLYPSIDMVFLAHPASFIVGFVANVSIFILTFRRFCGKKSEVAEPG